MKKMLALVLALMLVISLVPTAFAAETEKDTITITLPEGSAHTYNVYQILTGDLETNEEGNTVLVDTKWGTGQTNYTSGTEVTADTTVANIKISELTAENLDAFVAGLRLSTIYEVLSANDHSVDVATGYYLIIDQGPVGDGEAYSKYIMQVVDDVTINPKSDAPTLDKQVQDETADKEANADANGWGETADHQIGDNVPFKLIATINHDANFAYYDTYPMYFTDVMSDGLTLNQDSIQLYVGDVLVSAESYSVQTDIRDTNDPDDNTVYDFVLNIPDAKALKNAEGATIEIPTNASIIVTFTATLNGRAISGNEDDNYNTGDLYYKHSPDSDGWGSTEEDTVWVFTYNIESNKVNENKEPLANAKFQLKDSEGNVVSLVLAHRDKADDGTEEKYYYRPAMSGDNTSVIVTEMTSPAGGFFTVYGLDVGTYTLVETEAPEGYNTADDITIVIEATHAEDASSTTAAANITMNSESPYTVEIVNKAGTQLPETGGIGTTIFYVAGAALVLAAVVLLVTKKRMAAED